jgi:hypothetical protein
MNNDNISNCQDPESIYYFEGWTQEEIEAQIKAEEEMCQVTNN